MAAPAAPKPISEKPLPPPPAPTPVQTSFGPYTLPSLDLLEKPPVGVQPTTTVVEDAKLNAEVLRQTLLEFGIEAEDVQPQHRHISHLYGVYPGWMFTPEHYPEYYEACRKSLDHRGDESTGWAMAWRVAMWARFLDGDRALKVIGNLLRYTSSDAGTNYAEGGGLYANLFDAPDAVVTTPLASVLRRNMSA